VALSRRWQPELLADTRWAPLLLTVGAAGGFARVLDETGMAELWPSTCSIRARPAGAVPRRRDGEDPAGNSLSAVLTASGMIEPMLPALGLDSATGARSPRVGRRGLDRDLPRQRSAVLDRRA
jgi:GntP family gluconate:H+ symporter